MELAILLLILLIVVAITALKLSDVGLAFPFSKKTNLFSPVERNFLNLLDNAMGSQYRILCRVRLSDVLSIRPNTDKKLSRSALSQAGSKSVDFILCDKKDMSPVVAIDLVQLNSEKQRKAQKDWYVSGALDAANIPLIRIKAKADYTAQDIRDCINAKLAPIRYREPKQPLVKGTLSSTPNNTAPSSQVAA